jgi:hypothetical protein
VTYLLRAAILVLVLAATASAEPTARVVLVDPDPELQRAVATALAPWRLELIVDPTPVDAGTVSERADAQSARFVVWREGSDLIVFDRDRGEAEHREASTGALDPVAAAAAALTVKTLMRLPPEPPPEPEPEPPVVLPVEPPGGPEVRVQAGFITRIARGSETDLGARFVGAALVRPWADAGWRFGLAGDVGTTATIQQSGFKGSWSDWAVLAVASWTHLRGTIEIEPYLAAGITRSTFVGDEMMIARDESELLAAVRGGVWVRWRRGMWSLGGVAGVDAVPGTPTYTKTNNDSLIYEVPSFGAVIGIVIAADLGR